MKLMASIILFNPEIERLKENIDAIYDQVDLVLLVNNGSDNLDQIEKIVIKYDRIAIRDNKSNLGIATALKEIMDYAIAHKFDWVLTLDQDSVCQPEIIEKYMMYCELDKVGILTCNIVDRNFISESGFEDEQEYREVSQCITSGSLICVTAYCLTDGFDEKLFIDSVDFDICINMRLHGFKIIKVNYDGILHEVGHGENVQLLFKKYVAYNHSLFRQYYMARNHKYLVMKYPDQFSKTKEVIREIRAEIIILIYEKDKIKKLVRRWKGLREAKSLLSQR